MTDRMKKRIGRMAEECVAGMGDIFWDRDTYPDATDYADPFAVARSSVERTLTEFVKQHRLSHGNTKCRPRPR